jgi:glycosyltransferase involved in cell wall biosynthesis
MSETLGRPTVYAIYFRPADFARRSGLEPLAEAVGAVKLTHGCFWRSGARINWRVEEALKRWGTSYFGSPWNYLMPVWDEYRLAAGMRGPCIAHFLFAEFAGPRRAGPFRRRGARVVGTFHASPRRQEQVNGRMPVHVYDCISVVARAQQPFFEARGVPRERIFFTPHGVDTNYFAPDPNRVANLEGPLRGLLVGSTERDHAFAAALMRALPPGMMHLAVATKPHPHPAYRDARNVMLVPHLDDAGLVRAYQQADLLVMPMLDATANNAMLEAMACGTPVLTNRTSGTADYVDPTCNDILEGKDIDAWCGRVLHWHRHRDALAARRSAVRRWAESLSWERVAPAYRAMYARAMGES